MSLESGTGMADTLERAVSLRNGNASSAEKSAGEAPVLTYSNRFYKNRLLIYF
jgi:hypothetical protein